MLLVASSAQPPPPPPPPPTVARVASAHSVEADGAQTSVGWRTEELYGSSVKSGGLLDGHVEGLTTQYRPRALSVGLPPACQMRACTRLPCEGFRSESEAREREGDGASRGVHQVVSGGGVGEGTGVNAQLLTCSAPLSVHRAWHSHPCRVVRGTAAASYGSAAERATGEERREEEHGRAHVAGHNSLTKSSEPHQEE
jgi:hypothetical protein